jgi:hypothetical protein
VLLEVKGHLLIADPAEQRANNEDHDQGERASPQHDPEDRNRGVRETQTVDSERRQKEDPEPDGERDRRALEKQTESPPPPHLTDDGP